MIVYLVCVERKKRETEKEKREIFFPFLGGGEGLGWENDEDGQQLKI